MNDFFYSFGSPICTEKSRKNIFKKYFLFYFSFSSCIKEEALSK
jgi:hypothetical protein